MPHAPATLEGWYASHQIFSVPRSAAEPEGAKASAVRALRDVACPPDGGWSTVVPLVGSRGDVMIVHLRPTLEEIGAAERRVRREALFQGSALVYSFLSVTEAGLYHITARLAKEAEARGGAVGDAEFTARLEELSATERASPHVQRRLVPQQPADMPWVCFYPMSKRRQPEQNWYMLSLEERSQLMYAHGLTGRRYAGKVMQVITGAIGFDAWEWGVTLFARDPLDFKRLVTDMRFDEVSAKYAEFGEFFVGRVVEPEAWAESL